jgi:hypothetical protein
MNVTIILFMPDGWAASAGGFPAMTGNVPFLMKDVILFAASFYLLKAENREFVGTVMDITVRSREGRNRAPARPQSKFVAIK